MEVLMSNRSKKQNIKKLPFQSIAAPLEITETGISTDSGDYEADYILFATGYDYDLDFLQSPEELKFENKHVPNLYQHCLHTEHLDSLAILGINNIIIPFPFVDHQMRFVLSSWFGKLNLDKQTIESFFNKEANIRENFPALYAHKMHDGLQWKYLEDLDELIDEVPDFVLIQRELAKQ